MNKTFKEAKIENIEKLEQFLPIVERVHGGNHPEIFKVGKLFNQLNTKIKRSKEDPALDQEFIALRELTSNYEIPDDVCESFEAVYNMLESLDQAYSVKEEKGE